MTLPAKKSSISELQTELSLGKMGLAVEEIDHPVFVIWVDDFKFAYINESASEFIGLEPEFFYGKTTSELGAYFGSDNLENHYSPLLTQNVRSITYEAEHLNMNGENIPVEVLSQIVKPTDGRSFIVNISRDISKRKNAEKERSEFMSTIQARLEVHF